MASAAVIRATDLFERRKYADALAECREALAEDADDCEAEHLLARVLTEGGRPAMATMVLQHVLARCPDDASVHVSLGRAHRLAGDAEPALRSLQHALELDPRSLAGRLELVELHLNHEETGAALREADTAIGHHPNAWEPHFSRATALLESGQLEPARAAFAEAVRRDPAAGQRHQLLALLSRARGDGDGARRTLEAGLALRPGDPELRHLLAAAGATGADPGRASDDYLVSYFDRFAPQFDAQLQEIGYRTYDVLVAMVVSLAGDRAGTLDVLDAGCGTGLCGPGLRPVARRLVGVDISPGMLERARPRGVYDELHAKELTAFLLENPHGYDAIVAADVLTYFGDLTEVFGALARALRPGGIVAVSVERHEGEGYQLGSSGRWAHSAAHLVAAARSAGLVLDVREEDLREELGRPVRGLLGVAVMD